MFVSHTTFFATAEEVAQGHRSPAATQCLDVWTVGSFQVLICWYWSMDFFIGSHFIKLMLYSAQGGVSSCRVSRWIFQIRGGPGKVDVATLTNKPSKWVHALTISRSDRGPKRFTVFWIAKMMLALRLDRWPQGKRLKRGRSWRHYIFHWTMIVDENEK